MTFGHAYEAESDVRDMVALVMIDRVTLARSIALAHIVCGLARIACVVSTCAVLLGGFGATTPETVTQQIAAATKAGLAAVPSICGGACANLTGAWGFQISDEPAVSAFPKVAPLVAQAKAVGNMAFVNLLP
jgi:hypothetical protein